MPRALSDQTVMSTDTPHRSLGPGGSGKLRLVIYGLLFLTGVGLVIWAVTSISESSGTGMVPAPYQGARVVEPAELKEVESEVGHRIYWAGQQPGFEVAISRDPMGNVHVRYIPEGFDPEDPEGAFLDVGSYPFDGALRATRELVRQAGRVPLDFGNGTGFQANSRPNSVIVAFNKDPHTQVEVSHPVAGHAHKMIQMGEITPVP